MGLYGMPRRVYTYSEGLGLEGYNIVSTVGAFVLAAGFLLFTFNILWSLRWGADAPKNPWGADSLEWSFESAPQVLYPRIPVVTSRHPLWQEQADGGEPPIEPPRQDPDTPAYHRLTEILDHRPTDWRATLVVDAVTAQPQAIARMAGPSYMPLVTATGIMVFTVATIARLYALAGVGVVIAAAGIIAWLWPNRKELDLMRQSTLPQETGLPIFTTGSKSLGWMGMLFLIAVLGWCFSTLVYTYFYLRLYSSEWPQGGVAAPDPLWPACIYLLLVLAAAALGGGWRSFRAGHKGKFQLGLVAACFAATAFLGLHVPHLLSLPFTPQSSAYGSAFFTLSWAVDVAVLVGLGIAATGLLRSWPNDEDWRLLLALHAQIAAHYWCFAAVAAAVAFATLYLSPYVI
jgi:cytochrome c oxidase subunit I+III